MTAQQQNVAGNASRKQNPGLTPAMLNHAAYVTHDVEATANFYTRVMGMELASTVFDDRIPSTGDVFPYFHIFFRMKDGSTIAFFEAPDIPLPVEANHPAYEIFNHIALQASNREEVMQWYDWLISNQVEVVGPTDHNGLIFSVYFHDPNGIRLEITAPLDPDWNKHTDRGYKDLDLWVGVKKKAVRENRNVSSALKEFIVEQRTLRHK